MTYSKHASTQYLERQIMNASPAEQIVMLYDGAIKFLLKARQAIDEGNIQERYNANVRAGEIIAYLMSILNMEKGGEVSQNLNNIYLYMLNRLVDVDIKNDQQAIDDVVGKLKTLRKSWEALAKGETGAAEKKQSDAVTGQNDTPTIKKSALA